MRSFTTQVYAPSSVLINMKKHSDWQWGPFSRFSSARTDLWVHVRKLGQSLLCCCVFVCVFVCTYVARVERERETERRSCGVEECEFLSSRQQVRVRTECSSDRLADVRPFYQNALQKVSVGRCYSSTSCGRHLVSVMSVVLMVRSTPSPLCVNMNMASWQSRAQDAHLPQFIFQNDCTFQTAFSPELT